MLRDPFQALFDCELATLGSAAAAGEFGSIVRVASLQTTAGWPCSSAVAFSGDWTFSSISTSILILSGISSGFGSSSIVEKNAASRSTVGSSLFATGHVRVGVFSLTACERSLATRRLSHSPRQRCSLIEIVIDQNATSGWVLPKTETCRMAVFVGNACFCDLPASARPSSIPRHWQRTYLIVPIFGTDARVWFPSTPNIESALEKERSVFDKDSCVLRSILSRGWFNGTIQPWHHKTLKWW